jgi:hypothetical protein
VSTPTSSRTSTVVGIVLGLVILGLMAAFAIGLPKAHGEERDQPRELSLPDTLPGGYVASDDPAAFKDGQLAEQADTIAAQQRADADHGNKVLPDVLGAPAATRTYVAEDTQAVFVQVFESEGGAFAPNSLPAPGQDGSQPAIEMTTVGGGVCIITNGQSQTGEPADPAFSQCQVSRGGLTVQIGSAAIAAEDLVKVAGDLLDDLNDED